MNQAHLEAYLWGAAGRPHRPRGGSVHRARVDACRPSGRGPIDNFFFKKLSQMLDTFRCAVSRDLGPPSWHTSCSLSDGGVRPGEAQME